MDVLYISFVNVSTQFAFDEQSPSTVGNAVVRVVGEVSDIRY